MNRTIRSLAVLTAILVLVVLAGCKGGNSCERDFADTIPVADPGSGDPSGGGDTTPGGDNAPTKDLNTLLQLINSARATASVPLLSWDSSMASVAQNYAEYCAAKRTYSPTLSGTPSSRLRGGGVSFSQCDETGVYLDMVTLFINSEVFRKMDQSKLMSPTFSRIGIGYGICHYS